MRHRRFRANTYIWKNWTVKQKVLLFAYLVFIGLVAFYAFRKPSCNWDMLPYMALVLGPASHDSVYNLARARLTPENYALLTDGGLPYRREMAASASSFTQQMPFYSVKPLYTGLVYAGYHLGVPLMSATVLPSILAYIGIGILLLVWTRKYLPGAELFCVLVMVTGPMWEMARTSSPDGLSALLMLGGLFFLVESGPTLAAFALFLLAVFARIDNVLPAVALLALTVPVKRFAWMAACLGLAYLVVALTGLPYGWSILYYPSFAKSLNLDYAYHASFHFRDYVALAKSHLMTGLFYSYLFLFLALGCLVSRGFDRRLVLTLLGVIVVRFALQPIIADRLYIPYYLCVLVLLARRVTTPTT
jgi:hypothetical protein